MEWLRNIFAYSTLEKSLLNTDNEPSIYTRYSRVLDINGMDVYVVVAPPSNATKIPELPSIVLIHGLGGNVMTFKYLAPMLNRFCRVVLIDLPGHGKSPVPKYGTHAFSAAGITEIITKVILDTCGDSEFVAIGHSYGASHAVRVSMNRLKHQCRGVICIAPPYKSIIPKVKKVLAAYIPAFIFDSVFRSRDRRGGLHSLSVNRMVSPSCEDEPRRDQLKINLKSDSYTVLRTFAIAEFYDPNVEGFPSCPVLIIAATDDTVCPLIGAVSLKQDLAPETDVSFSEVSNAGHAILFERPEVVDGLVSNFLRENVNERLSMSWQLSYLASLDNKWSLKNEEKWKETQPVGAKVGPFKGMKVLREGDTVHGSSAFEELNPDIGAVIDLSREQPPYDPSMFKRVKYFKFPTVSKIPPSKTEVSEWIELVNTILQQLGDSEISLIGIHCHYGFNRTGFLICCYLIEHLHYTVPDAIAAYKLSREPGIRHQHFVDELYLRYCL